MFRGATRAAGQKPRQSTEPDSIMKRLAEQRWMMHEYSGWLSESDIPMEDLDREFEARLAESSTLAFRVAYGVLRNREDAEDVAQDAFAKAYRSFHTLRERERFRAWLVRITWRLAINRHRSNKRRLLREQVQID